MTITQTWRATVRMFGNIPVDARNGRLLAMRCSIGQELKEKYDQASHRKTLAASGSRAELEAADDEYKKTTAAVIEHSKNCHVCTKDEQ